MNHAQFYKLFYLQILFICPAIFLGWGRFVRITERTQVEVQHLKAVADRARQGSKPALNSDRMSHDRLGYCGYPQKKELRNRMFMNFIEFSGILLLGSSAS